MKKMKKMSGPLGGFFFDSHCTTVNFQKWRSMDG